MNDFFTMGSDPIVFIVFEKGRKGPRESIFSR